MAFRFNWPEFDSEFYEEARSQLEAALNKGNKPKNIVDHISVTELNMGTTVRRTRL
jgi:distribution and morphology protein 34